ncbi:hypothetical protein DPMN_184238 [Dreissena polymorpha]|uniref:Uncharacterized protein n=1 Tax=Dreissena polymorpha TaxID=45954 RepID=A0A9D4DIT4_DREPO|nr:hypothetical protein DPMN_184238 [Dreissena polymorpha]
MILSLNETSVSTSGSKKFGLGLPGKLRVGGAFDNAMTRFNGSMTCAQVKQDETRVHHFEIAMQECLTAKWPTVTASVGRYLCVSTYSIIGILK